MKKIIYVLLIIVISNKVYSQDQDILGRWNNLDIDSNISVIEFNSRNIAILFHGENMSPPFSFILDRSKNPIWIDMRTEKDGIEAQIFGLLEFIDSDKIKIEMFNNYGDHPDKFSIISSPMSQLYILNRMR